MKIGVFSNEREKATTATERSRAEICRAVKPYGEDLPRSAVPISLRKIVRGQEHCNRHLLLVGQTASALERRPAG